MKNILLACIIGVMCAGGASGKTISIAFNGEASFNPGLPGGGFGAPFGGVIEYSTDGATQVGTSPLFNGVWSNIDFNVNGANVSATPTASDNSLTQVQLGSGDDAWLSTYDGPFDSSGVPGINVLSVSLEIRTNFMDVFSTSDMLFDELVDGETFSLADNSFISLVVTYDTAFSDSSIFRSNNFDAFNVSVIDPAPDVVPLPAGLPLLLAGLGVFGVMRRRQG